jgi:hypothetical protein
MPKVFDDWKENVRVFCDDAAIRWKAEQEKDLQKIRSENSEDALTWQFFRSLEAYGLTNKWVAECLGIHDDFTVLYWQRRHDQSEIDPDIDACLARVEPIHRAASRQHTETDVMFLGSRTLIMAEVKLGYKARPITGWRQAETSPIVPTYEEPARRLMVAQADWKLILSQFAQLYKNLILGQCLADRWRRNGSFLELHLLAIVNGATVETLQNGTRRRYFDEFRRFCEGCALDQRRLHFVTWQMLRRWVRRQKNPDLQFVKERLQSHPLL